MSRDDTEARVGSSPHRAGWDEVYYRFNKPSIEDEQRAASAQPRSYTDDAHWPLMTSSSTPMRLLYPKIETTDDASL